MDPDRREALDEATTQLRADRLSRRAFIERTALLSVSLGATTAILDACTTGSSAQAGGAVDVQVMDAGGYVPQFAQDMINAYKRANPSKVSSITYLPRVQAPDLPGKLKVQQGAGRVTTTFITTGYDGVASCMQQGLVEQLTLRTR